MDEKKERSELQKSFEETREGWTDGVKSFDSRFPTIESFIAEFGVDALLKE